MSGAGLLSELSLFEVANLVVGAIVGNLGVLKNHFGYIIW